eukprot:Rhum_TRINITY_DN13073_c1_g2::Rhum_TRINITY_DN13073_c1_g2_i1::g.56771::m.56771
MEKKTRSLSNQARGVSVFWELWEGIHPRPPSPSRLLFLFYILQPLFGCATTTTTTTTLPRAHKRRRRRGKRWAWCAAEGDVDILIVRGSHGRPGDDRRAHAGTRRQLRQLRLLRRLAHDDERHKLVVAAAARPVRQPQPARHVLHRRRLVEREQQRRAVELHLRRARELLKLQPPPPSAAAASAAAAPTAAEPKHRLHAHEGQPRGGVGAAGTPRLADGDVSALLEQCAHRPVYVGLQHVALGPPQVLDADEDNLFVCQQLALLLQHVELRHDPLQHATRRRRCVHRPCEPPGLALLEQQEAEVDGVEPHGGAARRVGVEHGERERLPVVRLPQQLRQRRSGGNVATFDAGLILVRREKKARSLQPRHRIRQLRTGVGVRRVPWKRQICGPPRGLPVGVGGRAHELNIDDGTCALKVRDDGRLRLRRGGGGGRSGRAQPRLRVRQGVDDDVPGREPCGAKGQRRVHPPGRRRHLPRHLLVQAVVPHPPPRRAVPLRRPQQRVSAQVRTELVDKVAHQIPVPDVRLPGKAHKTLLRVEHFHKQHHDGEPALEEACSALLICLLLFPFFFLHLLLLLHTRRLDVRVRRR